MTRSVAIAELVRELLEGGPVGAGSVGVSVKTRLQPGARGPSPWRWMLVGGRDAGVAEQMSDANDGRGTL
jgi:hypothetical protein